MSKVAQLKKQAAEFEQKKQFDKALALYVKLLDNFDEHDDELDGGLFNRVGDLMLRQGNVADALDYYEKAVDRYAETGFFNNAIALCNKILRQSPGRASVYYKLGRISAQKGFKSEAKVNFLEYAERMQKAGKTDEAFRALKEFADLSPDHDEIRLMLADQLTKAGRKNEAIEQLQILHARYLADGQDDDASATADRIRALDPHAEIKSDESAGQRQAKSSDLVFLDLDDTPQPPRAAARAPAPSRAPTPAAPAPAPPRAPAPRAPAPPPPKAPSAIASTPVSASPTIDDVAIDEPAIEAPITRADVSIMGTPSSAMDAPLSGITRIGDDTSSLGVSKSPSQSLLGLEQTSLADDNLIRSTPTSSLLDIESTAIGTPPEATPLQSSAARGLEDQNAAPEIAARGDDLHFVVSEAEELGARQEPLLDFDLATPPEAPPAQTRSTGKPSATPSALDGLPLMDVDAEPAPKRQSQSLGELTDDLGLLEEPAAVPPPRPAPVPRPAPPPKAAPAAKPAPAAKAAVPKAAPPPKSAPPSRAAPAPTSAPEPIDLAAESLTLDEPIAVPTPPVAHPSTMVAKHSVELLQANVDQQPENWPLRRQLAEAMLEAGDRDGGIRELETAMAGADREGDLDLAMALAEELARLEPDAVRHHQKRVEYAFRKNDRPRLIEAYLGLGAALVTADQADKARTVYQRVLDLSPDEARARAAIDTLQLASAPADSVQRGSGQAARRSTAAQPAPKTSAPAQDRDFVNLGEWLRDDTHRKDTRMVVAEQEPTGDEEADFQDMLRKFKQGVAENVDAEDYQSHYDLAIAFKEMGLVDEAIAEFQKVLASPHNRLPTYEALGQCFLEKGSPRLALSILTRALSEQATEEQLVGVLYLLGRASEELGNTADALGYYQRVFVLDIQFRDIAERLNDVERMAQ
jgi:tetratricopeptide (TPR) repeat protein